MSLSLSACLKRGGAVGFLGGSIYAAHFTGAVGYDNKMRNVKHDKSTRREVAMLSGYFVTYGSSLGGAAGASFCGYNWCAKYLQATTGSPGSAVPKIMTSGALIAGAYMLGRTKGWQLD